MLTCRFWYDFILNHWPQMWARFDAIDGYQSRSSFTKSYKMPNSTRRMRQLLGHVQADQVRFVKLSFLYHVDSDIDNTDKNISAGPGNRSRLLLQTMIENKWNKLEMLGKQYWP